MVLLLIILFYSVRGLLLLSLGLPAERRADIEQFDSRCDLAHVAAPQLEGLE